MSAFCNVCSNLLVPDSSGRGLSCPNLMCRLRVHEHELMCRSRVHEHEALLAACDKIRSGQPATFDVASLARALTGGTPPPPLQAESLIAAEVFLEALAKLKGAARVSLVSSAPRVEVDFRALETVLAVLSDEVVRKILSLRKETP